MTAATPTAGPAVAPRRSPVVHVVRRLGRDALLMMLRFWGVVVPFFVGFSWWLVWMNGTLDAAVVLYSRQGAIWFPFAQGIVLVAAHLRVHLAAGMTRRTFGRATVVVAVGSGLAYGAVLTGLAAVEREVHHALGWGWRVADAVLATEASPPGLLLAELAVACVAGHVAGLLVGVVYQRVGGWWGTLALPLTAGPVLVVLTLLAGFGPGVPAGRTSWAAAAPVLLLCVGVVALTAAAYVAVTARTTVRPRTP